jgi:hypothetical protein
MDVVSYSLYFLLIVNNSIKINMLSCDDKKNNNTIVNNVQNNSAIDNISQTADLSKINLLKTDVLNNLHIMSTLTNTDQHYLDMVRKKAQQLLPQYERSFDSFVTKLLVEKSFFMTAIISLFLLYFMLSKILGLISLLCEILIFMVMPLKIAMHVFSSDTDIKEQMDKKIKETDDINYLKKIYTDARKTKRERLDYGMMLMRQSFVVMFLRLLMTLIPIIDAIPILSLFSGYIYLLILLLTIVIHIPVSLVNIFLRYITKMMGFIVEFRISTPMSDTIVIKLRRMIPESKINAIRDIRNMLMIYDSGSCESLNIDKMVDALNKIGISKNLINVLYINNKQY